MQTVDIIVPALAISIHTVKKYSSLVALFQSRSHLWLLACSMQIWRGRSGHMQWHHAGTQMVDTRGQCPTKDLEALSCNVCHRVGGQERLQGSINTVQCQGNCLMQNGNYTVENHPPCVYLMRSHMIRSPRPSPSVFAYCKWSIPEVGTAWEWG